MPIIKLNCAYPLCQKVFERSTSNIPRKRWDGSGNHFCNNTCRKAYRKSLAQTNCALCEKIIFRSPSIIATSKSGLSFCSISCSTKYAMARKTTGYRRSKMEKHFEEFLILTYPNLDFKFNSKKDINSELDVFIPELKLAFEINGICHFKPIYSKEQLFKIQLRDQQKMADCLKKHITLIIFDISEMKGFNAAKAQPYLKKAQEIIDDYFFRFQGAIGLPSRHECSQRALIC